MDLVKVNLGSPIYNIVDLGINEMYETETEIVIKTKERFRLNINVGTTLFFKRYVYSDNETIKELTGTVTVKKIVNKYEIHTDKLPEYRIPIDLTDGFENAISETSGGIVVKLLESHSVYAQDLYADVGQKVKFEHSDGTFTEYYNADIPSKYTDLAITSADCLTLVDSATTCGKSYESLSTYKYTFKPEWFDESRIIVKGANREALADSIFMVQLFNPFYYCIDDSEGTRRCYFWGDVWWGAYKNSNGYVGNERRIYVNSGETRSILGKNESYWNVSMGLAQSADESNLGSDDSFNNTFMDELKDSLIPDFIDMERVKYVPITDGDKLATRITIDLHFSLRKEQEKGEIGENSKNSERTKYNRYKDGWYLDEDKIGWNDGAMPGNERTFISDTLSDLNFTDDDVFYKKKKVNKSFLRFSYYNSNDPATQKLLFYSTVFLDGTELYGKFIRQLAYMEDNNVAFEDNAWNVVKYDSNAVSARVDTEITITNEYDTSRSAEGFNIYLFSDDVGIKDKYEFLGEKEYRTIYMKVEFNHAGCGKTIPMIMHPSMGTLKTNNFLSYLYIPLHISYNKEERVFQYKFKPNEDVANCLKYEEENIRLALFEPILGDE